MITRLTISLHHLVAALLLALIACPGVPASAAIPGAPAAEESEEVAEDPFNRETPRSMVTGLLNTLAGSDDASIGAYLDLPADREDQAPVFGRALQAALDSGGSLAVYQELSSDPEGFLDDGLDPSLEDVGRFANGERRIILSREETEDGQPVWRVSRRTLAALAAAVESGEITPAQAATGGTQIGGAPLWDWVKLVGLLVLVFAVFRALAALIQLAIRRSVPEHSAFFQVLNAALPPLALLITLITFRNWSDAVEISIVARQVLLRYLGIFGWIAVAWFLLRLVDGSAFWLATRMERQQRRQGASIINFARRVLKVGLLILAGLGIFDTLGFDVTTGFAALGIGGLVLALGAQKSVENLVGSVSVLLDRPIQVGDFCRVGDIIGTVEDIGMRSTRIRTTERTLVTIPNGDFSSRQIENYAKRDRFLFNETIGLEYSSTPSQVRQAISIIENVLTAHEKVSEDPCRAKLRFFAADSLSIETYAYIEVPDYVESLNYRQEILLAIYDGFDEAGIPFAFPTQTVYLRREVSES